MDVVAVEARALLVMRLAEARAAGALSTREVRAVAQSIGVTERTLWRWLQRGGAAGTRGRPAYRLAQGDLDAYTAAHGNCAAAWRAQQAAGARVPSLRAFQAAIGRQLLPIERASVVEGSAGRRRHTVYLRWEVQARNERWEADHVELPVLVLPPRASRPHKPWATVFIDAYSRLVMGWALSLTPSAASVLAAFRSGLLVDSTRGPFGGVPGALRPDRGLEFAAEALAVPCAIWAPGSCPLPPTRPT